MDKEMMKMVVLKLWRVSEALACLGERLDFYKDDDEISKHVFESVEQLRAETFELCDQVLTLAKKEDKNEH